MKYDEQADQRQIKKNRNTLLMMALLALCFGLLITKEVSMPTVILYAVAGILGTYLITQGMSNPEIVTYFLVTYLPYSKVLVGDFGGLAAAFNLTNLLMIFIVVVWFSGRYSGDEPLWLSSPLNAPIAVFIIIGMIAVFRGQSHDASYLHYAITEFKRWITPILMFYLVLNTVKKRESIRNIIIIMIITTTMVGLMAILDYINLGEVSSMEKSRIGGVTDQPNTLAAFFVYYMFLPLGFFLMNMKKARSWWLLVPFLIQFRGIMVTFSRGGYVAFAFGLYAITFIRSRGLFALLIVASVVSIFNPWMLPGGVRDRMMQTFVHKAPSSFAAEEEAPQLEASANSRFEIWKGAWEIIKENPVFGCGYGLFPYYIKSRWSGGIQIDAHNTYIILAAEQGIPCVIVFLIIVFMAIGYAWRLYAVVKDPFIKSFLLGALGGLFGLLMANMFGSRLNHQEVSSYFWIILALIMRVHLLQKKGALDMPEAGSAKRDGTPKRRRGNKLDSVWFEEPPDEIVNPRS